MYRIYAKAPGMKRFKALDVKRGVVVENLIHATFYETRGEALHVLNNLACDNLSIQFDLRKV